MRARARDLPPTSIDAGSACAALFLRATVDAQAGEEMEWAEAQDLFRQIERDLLPSHQDEW